MIPILNLLKIHHHSEQLLSSSCLKSDKNSTDFHGKDEPKVGVNYICIPIRLIDSIVEKEGKYYSRFIWITN